MAKISGKDGAVKYGAVPTEVNVTGFSFSKSIAVKDVSDSSSTSGKDFIADGLYEISGSFEGFIEGGVAQPTFGTEIAFELEADGSTQWAGNGIITSQNETLQVVGGEAVKVSYNFQGTGAWTRTN